MQLLIKIKTAKGSASTTSNRIKPLILGIHKVKHDIYINDDDDEMVWNVEGSVREVMSIHRNLCRFDSMIKGILNSKLVRMAASKDFTKDQWKELEELLKNKTSVEVVKKASAEELVEANTTWWQRIKKTFKKQN